MKSKHDAIITSDSDIIELYFARDESAITKTDEKYGKMLMRLAYNILHDRLDAEECKSDTYLSVWNAVPPTCPAVLGAFLTEVLRRTAISRYRERTGKKRVPSELTASIDELAAVLACDDTTEDDFSAHELGRLISAYVHSLEKRERYIFVSRFYMGETIAYIADTLGVGTTTVHREIKHLKDGLRAHLSENGVNV